MSVSLKKKMQLEPIMLKNPVNVRKINLIFSFDFILK